MTCYTDLVSTFSQAVEDTTGAHDYLPLLKERNITPSTYPAGLDCSQLNDAEVQAVITFLIRQERFGDGLIADALDNATFITLLHRLEQLSNELLDVPLP